jgi:hypothetical protein
MHIKEQLLRVEIAGENLENAPIHKTKKAAKALGDETKKLFTLFANELAELKQQILAIKKELK